MSGGNGAHPVPRHEEPPFALQGAWQANKHAAGGATLPREQTTQLREGLGRLGLAFGFASHIGLLKARQRIALRKREVR